MIPSAEKARERSKKINDLKLQGELKMIETNIERAIEKGYVCFDYSGDISKEAREILERLGYRIQVGSQYNESYVSITWAEDMRVMD